MKTLWVSMVGTAVAATLAAWGAAKEEPMRKPEPAAETEMNTKGLQQAVFGAGCFWCTEAVFQRIPGVKKVESGFMGGTAPNPTYEQVCTGTTGHAEVSRIWFDPKEVSYDQLLDMFWHMHDPTSMNRQGADTGTQYRSAIFYLSDKQREEAEASKKKAQAMFDKPIVTEITKAGPFYMAEGYHQDYYNSNSNAPYCRFVIQPKLKKLGL